MQVFYIFTNSSFLAQLGASEHVGFPVPATLYQLKRFMWIQTTDNLWRSRLERRHGRAVNPHLLVAWFTLTVYMLLVHVA